MKSFKAQCFTPSDDVKLFSQFIMKEARECYNQLKEKGFDYKTWFRLGKAELVKLIMFNRRRMSEVASMLMDLFHSRKSLDELWKKR
jgi:hypothetical protein